MEREIQRSRQENQAAHQQPSGFHPITLEKESANSESGAVRSSGCCCCCCCVVVVVAVVVVVVVALYIIMVVIQVLVAVV